MPEAPAGLRGGGSTSAGMISTVQTPLPIFAETAPKIWPHFCAPSPGSETISMVCSRASITLGALRTFFPASFTFTVAIGDLV